MPKPLPNPLNIHRYKRKNKCLIEDLDEGVTLTLMLIPGGEFLMGTPESTPDSNDNERPLHRVKIEPFLMGCYPVTRAQWRRIVALHPKIERKLNLDPSYFKGQNRPVENVSWNDATEFCQRLSAQTGREYRLPSEAQWEYAARAGTTTPFHFGETISTELANYDGNYTYNGSPQGEYRRQTTDVGSFPANAWGLHDMHGNVWEWCEDDYHHSYEKAPNDGRAWVAQNRRRTRRVLRGGSWANLPEDCRSASRSSGNPRDNFDFSVGFRVVCSIPKHLISYI